MIVLFSDDYEYMFWYDSMKDAQMSFQAHPVFYRTEFVACDDIGNYYKVDWINHNTAFILDKSKSGLILLECFNKYCAKNNIDNSKYGELSSLVELIQILKKEFYDTDLP